MPRYYPIVTVEGREQVYQFDPSSPPSPQQISEWANALGGTYTGRLASPGDPRTASAIPDPSLAPESASPGDIPSVYSTGLAEPGFGPLKSQEQVAKESATSNPTFLSMIPSIVAGSTAPAALGPLINAIPDPRLRAAAVAAGPLIHTLARGVLAAGGGAAGAIPGHYIQQSQRTGALSQHPYYGIPESQTGPSLGSRVYSEALFSAIPELAASVPLGILQGIRSKRLTRARMPEIRHLTDVQADAGLSPPSARGILKSGTLRRMETSRTVRELGTQHLDALLSEAHHQLDQLGGKVAGARDPRLLDPEKFASTATKLVRQEITPGPVETKLMLGKLKQAAAAAGSGIAPTMANARKVVATNLIKQLEDSSGFPIATLLSGEMLLEKARSANRLGELTKLGETLPELGELIRRAHLAELISSSSNALRSGQPVFQPTLFLKAIDRTPDDVLRAVYGKKGYQNLRNFTDALSTTPEATEVARTRLSPSGSFAATRHGWPIVATVIGALATGTGAAVGLTPQNIGPMGAGLFYVTTGALFAAPAVVNRLLRSEDGVRWLTGATKTANKWTGSPDQLQRTLLRTAIQAGIHNILTGDPISTALGAELDDQFTAPEFTAPPIPRLSRPPTPQLTNPPIPQLSSAPTNLPAPVAAQSRVPVEVTPEERISRFIRSKNPLTISQRR